jgi:hypothetical protein
VSHGIRRALALLLTLGLLGTSLELILFEHHEDVVQTIPLALLVAAAGTLAAMLLHPGPATVGVFRAAMGLLVLGGLLGVGLHLRANLEFQAEVDPGLRGWALYVKALHAKAPPALAPAVLAQLGLLGLVLAHGHARRGDVQP